MQVAAAFYPLQYVADRVAGDHAEVENLTAPGGEPHDLELTPKETADVAQADLVVFQRGFQPSVDDAVDENAEGDVLDVADVVDLVPFRDHGVDSDEDDPHFWQDPLLLADVGDAVAEQLAKVDPTHADDYAANAADLRADLEQLDQEYAAGLSRLRARHDRRQPRRVRLPPAVRRDDGRDPRPLPRLRADPGRPGPAPGADPDDGITTVFSETLASPETAESLADDMGVRSEVLDPIEGLTDETADEDYLSLMRTNLAALEEANGC